MSTTQQPPQLRPLSVGEVLDASFKIVRQSFGVLAGCVLVVALPLNIIDTLITAGESTSGCVRATVTDAYSHGFDVMVVEEATFDRIEISHKVNLFDLHHKYATVVHLSCALTYLESNPMSPA